jgi:hypothetical protein
VLLEIRDLEKAVVFAPTQQQHRFALVLPVTGVLRPRLDTVGVGGAGRSQRRQKHRRRYGRHGEKSERLLVHGVQPREKVAEKVNGTAGWRGRGQVYVFGLKSAHK